MKKIAPSPVGRGIHARDTPVGKTATGADGAKWVVSEDKNGRHFWKKWASAAKRKAVAPKKTKKAAAASRPARRRAASPKKKPLTAVQLRMDMDPGLIVHSPKKATDPRRMRMDDPRRKSVAQLHMEMDPGVTVRPPTAAAMAAVEAHLREKKEATDPRRMRQDDPRRAGLFVPDSDGSDMEVFGLVAKHLKKTGGRMEVLNDPAYMARMNRKMAEVKERLAEEFPQMPADAHPVEIKGSMEDQDFFYGRRSRSRARGRRRQLK